MTNSPESKNTVELLAPAKDLACGMAAIDCGADAVYIGAPRFGAREAAGNSLDDIAALVRHAHRCWARVYVTCNTLLFDDEIPPALAMIARLHDIGIDGLIIQDAGLLECDLPPIPLIASTQMHNATPERVAFLEQVGVSRAILARELDLAQIRAIRARTTLELECFIHGALCVSYSGQCYLSYALGGRSGNRGQCAQPCRKRYDLCDGQGNVLVRGKHLLSPGDLNLSAHLTDLLDAGVRAFKIEGRLKDRAYVVNVVSYYRQALDAILPARGFTKSSSGASTIDFTPDLSKTFHRPYTSYFLHGRRETVGAIDTPKMIGEPIGPVTAISRTGVTLDTAIPLRAGDGICFFTQGDLGGTTINAVQGATITPARLDGLEVGTQVYRNHDHDFLTRLDHSRPRREIALEISVADTADGLRLTARDEDGVAAEYVVACAKVPATNPAAAWAALDTHLRKCGGTGYTCTAVRHTLSAPLFFPVSAWNAMRRELLDALTAAREARRPRASGGPVRNEAPFPHTALDYRGNVTNHRAEAFYRRHGVTIILPGAERGTVPPGKPVMTLRYCVKHQLGRCPRQHPGDLLPAPLFLRDADGHRLALRFDCAHCTMTVLLG